jgi:predicted enzyme related to lactoylglutathione lyase
MKNIHAVGFGSLLASLLLAGCEIRQAVPPVSDSTALLSSEDTTVSSQHFLGLRTVKYSAKDLAEAKRWYIEVTGITPYFDEPFYVGFNVGGYELGITPDSNAAPRRAEAGIVYWGVTNADSAWTRLIGLGATPNEPIQDVGEGIRIGSLHDPFGNLLGIIENRHFMVTDTTP